MRAVRACALATLVLAAAPGCAEKKKAEGQAEGAGGGDIKLWGIDPSDWTCDQLATPAAMSEVLGGATRTVDSPMGTAPGTPRPCTFVFEGGASPEAWSFDLDCRPRALETAEKLFAEYAAQNLAYIEAFDAQTGGKVVKTDAGVELKSVAPPVDVAVGKKGLDHHGMQVLFIDDDAPCYVRVSGPDAARRLAVAELIARKLTPQNAPMRPYPAPAAPGK